MHNQVIAVGCLGWYTAVALVTTLGTVQIYRHYSSPPRKPISSNLRHEQVPYVTIIRPCKGVEPFLYECLASTFHQDYPRSRFAVHFCVASKSDPAYTILQKLIEDYSAFETNIFVEEEDPVVQGHDGGDFGPNPKIRNMSRAYREAKGDIVWILDCNIWVGYGTLGRMTDKLCGFTVPSDGGAQGQKQKPYKLVAHLPVCVDVDNIASGNLRQRSVSASATDDPSSLPYTYSIDPSTTHLLGRTQKFTGSMLEMSFLSTAHAKMYVAINSVSIAPCINGKSTMFRKSHLNHLTNDQGIDFFGHNICEDHLIGDLLWKSYIPARLGFENDETQISNPNGLPYRNHGLAVGDLAIQPVAGMSVTAYIARRVRWLRVRKFTVMLATLVEPGTESLLCSAMGAYAVTTLNGLQEWFGASWAATAVIFITSILYWVTMDWLVSGIIQGMGSVETDSSKANTVPPFARPVERQFPKWLRAWFGREALALPIWTWAIWGGTTVTWRDRRFWVGVDMRVHAIDDADQHRGMERKVNGSKLKNGTKVQ